MSDLMGALDRLEQAAQAGDSAVATASAGAYRLLKLSEIEPNPHNVRTTITGVRELADSVAQYGLLENLVVSELFEDERDVIYQEDGGPPELGPAYRLEAGSRRYAALELLTKEGKRHPEEPVMCLVISSTGLWQNLVENIQRAEVHPWDIGRRLHEAECGGLTHRAIADKVGRSQGWVSRHIAISRGLHPGAIDFILKNKLLPKLLQSDLFRLSAITDARGEPNLAAQIAFVERAGGRQRRSTKRRYTSDNIRAFGARLSYLRTQMRIPPTIRPIIAAVLDYIEQGGRLDLNKLELQMLDAKRQFVAALDKGD